MAPNSSNKSKAIFQYLCMSKVYAEILRNISRPILEISAFKGPNLAQMTNFLEKDLKNQTRPLFHLF